MKILILWSSLSDYMVASFREMVAIYNVDLFWIYQPPKTNAPFDPFDLSFCKGYYEDNTKSISKIKSHIIGFEPDIVFMASWNFSHYMKLSKQYKKRGTPVISSFDNQWKGTFKQYLGILTNRIFLKPSITNFIVPGDRQAAFAQKMRYPETFQGFYCANSNNFVNTKTNLQHNSFVFVGRFVEDKSIRELIEAYRQYRNSVKNPWQLRMIGKGPLEKICLDQKGVIVEGFTQPQNLPNRLIQSSCFILPSKFENWGLVIHEAALSGLPIICTSACGASTWFVRDGQSGYLCMPEINSIKKSLIRIHNLSKDQIKEMSDISYTLGNLWTTSKWASYIYNSFKTYLP